MDRTNLSNAISDDLALDLGFTNDGVNTSIQVYSVIFTIVTLFANVISKRVGPHLWIPILMSSWAIVTWAHVLTHNFGGFMAVRVFIALTEAGFIPTCLVYLTGWYKTAELATRLAWFWGVQSFASAFSGLISFGVFRLAGVANLEGWKWLFLLDGIFTHIIAFIAFFFLPASPSKTAGGVRGRKGWFTEREIHIAVTRLIRDDLSKTEQHVKKITWTDIKLAVLDTKIWTHLVITFIGMMPDTPITTYLPSIIRSGGFDTEMANLLTVPSYIINLIFSILIAWSSDRYGEVGLHALLGTVWKLVGFVVLRTLPVDTGRWSLFAGATVAVSSPSWHGMHIAWMSSNVAPVGKRALALGAIIGSANINSLPGGIIYQNWDAPRYFYGNTINIILCCVTIVLFLIQRYRYVLTNKYRERKWNSMTVEEQQTYLKTTDKKGSNRLDFRFRI
ncbi:major facilitator superfamily domain-containing protein [Syncephalastrum racemosum]|uniref:Major facilitator superfamily domain-containing protein n=1 Tax=Syncephalastrum racemosum TaxID=13706 RepID=A0A1X2H6P0_SYNRA|nr:major facilitator superfamily domain-containing protein [Syncephalastrum racemosum]